jgi:hypothetical protein
VHARLDVDRALWLLVPVVTIAAPGAYRQFDLVQEFVAWLEGMDAHRLIVSVPVS